MVLQRIHEDLDRLYRQISLILIVFSGISSADAAAKPGGRLIVQGRRYDHRIPAGRHVLTLTAVPNIVLSYPSSITVNVRPGGTYIFTALWDSDHVYLRPTTLSPAEMAKVGL